MAGYEDVNDAVRVSADPTFRLIGSKRNWDRRAALTSTLHGFETEMLASEENLLGLMAVNRELVAQAETQDDSERVVLDMDSTESPVHGQQEGSAYNGHFESVCYHPLLLFNQHGDCLAAKLRPGNVHSAEDWNELLLPEIERQQAAGKQVTFRGDAAFAKPEIYESSEERGVQYAIRIPANNSLELAIEDILFRPPGRPSRKPLVRYKSFRYQAESWSKARRIVAKVEHHQGELFPRVGFIVTSMSLPRRSVVRFYNKRGTAEQWIKEGKQATYGMSASGRDESRPYIPDGRHLPPLLVTAGEKCGSRGSELHCQQQGPRGVSVLVKKLSHLLKREAGSDGGHHEVADLMADAPRANILARLGVMEVRADALKQHSRVHLNDDHATLGPADASHLAQRDIEIQHMFERQRAEDTVKGVAVERQRVFEIVNDEANPARAGFVAGLGQHLV